MFYGDSRKFEASKERSGVLASQRAGATLSDFNTIFQEWLKDIRMCKQLKKVVPHMILNSFCVWETRKELVEEIWK